MCDYFNDHKIRHFDSCMTMEALATCAQPLQRLPYIPLEVKSSIKRFNVPLHFVDFLGLRISIIFWPEEQKPRNLAGFGRIPGVRPQSYPQLL